MNSQIQSEIQRLANTPIHPILIILLIVTVAVGTIVFFRRFTPPAEDLYPKESGVYVETGMTTNHYPPLAKIADPTESCYDLRYRRSSNMWTQQFTGNEPQLILVGIPKKGENVAVKLWRVDGKDNDPFIEAPRFACNLKVEVVRQVPLTWKVQPTGPLWSGFLYDLDIQVDGYSNHYPFAI